MGSLCVRIVEQPQGWHRAADRRDRNRLAPLPVHHELADDAGTVRFEKEEPVCMISPVPHGTLQDIVPEIIDLDSEPEVKQQTMDWKERCDEFMRKLNATTRKR
jgi:hypothetical protein